MITDDTDMASMRMWIKRRVRLRYFLLAAIFLTFLYTVRSVVIKLDERSSSPDYDAPSNDKNSNNNNNNKGKDGKTSLRRGPKIKEELNLGFVNRIEKPVEIIKSTKINIRPGEQILMDNILEEAFEIAKSPKPTVGKSIDVPESRLKLSNKTPNPRAHYVHHQKVINPKESILGKVKLNESNRSEFQQKQEVKARDNIVPAETKVNERIPPPQVDLGQKEPKLSNGNQNSDMDTLDIAKEDTKLFRIAKTNPPWQRTMKPIRIEDYRKNCSEGSIPVPGSSFHRDKFCLIDDSHEYFGVYGDQTCYHRGTNYRRTRTRVKKHHACECHRGWYGKYCSMPDVVFNGKYPYEYGVEIQVPPRRIMFAFPFNGEFAMLETIVHSLHNVVDAFLILESNYTAAGKPKERELLTKLEKNYLQQFQYKMVYISLDYFPKEAYSNGWVIDGLLRNHIGEVAFGSVLENVRDHDIIVSTDADEVMTEESLAFLKLHYGYPEPFGFTLRHTVFGYFWEAPKRITSAFGGCSVALLRELLKGHLYDIRNGPKNTAKDQQTLRKFRKKTGVLVKPWTFGSDNLPAGWHCSWCFLPPGIRTKLISAHASDFPRWGTFEDKTNLPFITKLVRNGTWFDEKTRLKSSEDLYGQYYAPRYVRDNEKKYGYLLEHGTYMNQSKQYLHSKDVVAPNANVRSNFEGNR